MSWYVTWYRRTHKPVVRRRRALIYDRNGWREEIVGGWEVRWENKYIMIHDSWTEAMEEALWRS